MVLQHACYVQVLNAYQGVVFAEVGSELVGGILANVGHTGVLFCQLATGLLAVLATFVASGLLPFQATKPLLCVLQCAWIRKALPIRAGCKHFNAKIDADSSCGRRNRLSLLFFSLDGDEPAPSLLRDRSRKYLRIGGNEIMFVEAQASQARQLHRVGEDFDRAG